jgi:hypothetical protein
MAKEDDNVMGSLMVPLPIYHNNSDTEHHYSFGGLLPVTRGNSCSEIKGREVSSLAASRRETVYPSQIK